jgi:cyclophilin family peptidyl-prolyl cis-trans isomerase
MKKIIFCLFICLLTASCSFGKNNTVLDEKSVPYGNGNINSEINKEITEIGQGKTPKVKPTGKSEPAKGQDDPSAAKTEAAKQINMEDLKSQFTQAVIKTNMGDIKVKFYNTESPLTVNNFMNLAKQGFYNTTKFHRVIKDFMIQGGDPNSKDDDWSNDGMGGPGYAFQDEINSHQLVRGSLAMANSGPNTNGSQFFIVTKDATPWLDGKHTNFGEIIGGLDVVSKIEAVKTNENDHPMEDVVINGIELIK